MQLVAEVNDNHLMCIEEMSIGYKVHNSRKEMIIMLLKNKNRQLFLKYLIITSVFIMGVSLFVFFYIELSSIKTSKLWIEDKEDKVIQTEVSLLEEEIDLVVSDLDFLKNQLTDTLATTGAFNDIENQWLIFSRSKNIYDQIRFIDKEGYEKIIITNANTQSVLVNSEGLQYKGDQYYYLESAKMLENQVYVSPFDLNLENDKVTLPRKPIIRFATPIVIEGEFQGIVVINYLGINILDKFQKLLVYSKGELYLVNQSGYYLYSGDLEQDFAFMFDDNEDASFINDFPTEWAQIKNSNDRILTEKGLFSFDRIQFRNKRSLKSTLFSEDEWFVVSHIKKDSEEYYFVRPKIETIIKNVIVKNSVYFSSLFILAVFIASLVYENKKSYNKIMYLSEYDGMTGLLNRRAGLNSLKELLRTYDERSGEMYLCYLDIDGLKYVNDNFGHLEGDALILTVVKIINSVIRESDVFIRLGGDEFLLVLHHMGVDVHEYIWTRIENNINLINAEEERRYKVSISKGFVKINKEGSRDIKELMKMADEEMYIDKQSKNR